jgi:hypothetical protein
MGFFSHLGGGLLGTAKSGSGANMGAIVVSQTNAIAFAADGTSTPLFTLPAGAQIHTMHVDVTTAFNAATTNTIKLGTASGGTQLMTATSVSSAGRLATTNMSLSTMANVGTSDITVYATYNQTGTAATAGAATITLLYSVRNADGSVGNLP